MRLSIKEIFKSTHGSYVVEPASEDVVATGLVWDSREVSEGCIYLALPGERVDGRAFVTQAFGKGAVCALVMGDVDEAAMDAARDSGLAIISVANTYKAIEDLAAYWRGKLNGRVIGFNGENHHQDPRSRRSFRARFRRGHPGKPEQRDRRSQNASFCRARYDFGCRRDGYAWAASA